MIVEGATGPHGRLASTTLATDQSITRHFGPVVIGSANEGNATQSYNV